MTLSWERVGSTGAMPPILAEGYSFAETPALNEAIHRRTENDDWNDVVARLRATHAEVLAVIERYDAAALFTKQRSARTRSAPTWCRPRRATTPGRRS